jgi:hypothetical protein
MRNQDKQAGAAFVGILVGCNTIIGLIMALIVFYSCL